MVSNSVQTWTVEDQLEDDSVGVSWSVQLGQMADISVTAAPGFISVVGTTVTFSPTLASEIGTHSYTIKQSKAGSGCPDTDTIFSVIVTAPACSSFTWKPPTGNPVSFV